MLFNKITKLNIISVATICIPILLLSFLNLAFGQPDKLYKSIRDFGVRPEAGLGQVEKLRKTMKKDVERVLEEDLTKEGNAAS